MSSNEVEGLLQLALRSSHVWKLFNTIRSDSIFCQEWISSSALAEIITIKFKLHEHNIVLEAKQLTDVLHLRNRSALNLFIENLIDHCTQENVALTSIYTYRGQRQKDYCFPEPNQDERRTSRSASSPAQETRVRKSRRNQSQQSNQTVQQPLPPIPYNVLVMEEPACLMQLRRNKLLHILLRDVLVNDWKDKWGQKMNLDTQMLWRKVRM